MTTMINRMLRPVLNPECYRDLMIIWLIILVPVITVLAASYS